MPNKTQAEITYSQLLHTSTFKMPILEAWLPAKLIASILGKLEPSGYKLDGVEANVQIPKLDDYSIVFRRTAPPFPPRSLTLGLGKAIVTADNLEWTEAEQFISGHSAAINVIREVSGAEIQSQELVVALHIQLKDRPRKDVTAPLISNVASSLLDDETDCSGVILSREEAIVLIDASAAVANGLFVRITRRHSPAASFEKQAEILRSDEQRIFEVLGLEGVL